MPVETPWGTMGTDEAKAGFMDSGRCLKPGITSEPGSGISVSFTKAKSIKCVQGEFSPFTSNKQKPVWMTGTLLLFARLLSSNYCNVSLMHPGTGQGESTHTLTWNRSPGFKRILIWLPVLCIQSVLCRVPHFTRQNQHLHE